MHGAGMGWEQLRGMSAAAMAQQKPQDESSRKEVDLVNFPFLPPC